MSIRLPLLLLVLIAAPFAGADIDRFKEVSPGIYRGGQPTEEIDYAHLRDLGIKTIINLRGGGDIVAWESIQAAKYGIQFIHVPLKAYEFPSKSEVTRAHEAMTNPDNQPVFVHCKRGRDRTGLMIGVHRVLDQSWTRKEAWDEMVEHGFTDEFVGLSYAFFRHTGGGARAWVRAIGHLIDPRD